MFIAYLEQRYPGCDYTIGCGKRLIKLDGQTRDAAIVELRSIVVVDYGSNSDTKLKKATLYEVVDKSEQPIQQWYDEADAADLRAEQQEAERQERIELERLRKKYG